MAVGECGWTRPVALPHLKVVLEQLNVVL